MPGFFFSQGNAATAASLPYAGEQIRFAGKYACLNAGMRHIWGKAHVFHA